MYTYIYIIYIYIYNKLYDASHTAPIASKTYNK